MANTYALPELQNLLSGKKQQQTTNPQTLGQFYQNTGIAGKGNTTQTGGAVLKNSAPQQQQNSQPQDSYLNQLAKTDRNPSQEAEYQKLLGQAQPFNAPDFDALIRPAIEGYQNYIGTLQGQLPGVLSQIDQSLTGRINETKSSIGGQERTINTAKEGQAQQQSNAANEAKRLFSEMQSSVRGAYGGGSSYGLALESIGGSDAARNIASIRTAGAQLQKELDDKLVQVQEIGRLAIEDAQREAEQQKLQARNQLETQIASIRSKIGETQANKAQLYASAYESYQGYVRQVEMNNTAFLQDLYTRQKQSEINLNEAKQRASQISSTANPQDLTKLVEQFGQIGLKPSSFSTNTGAGNLTFSAPDEDPYGLGGGFSQLGDTLQ